MALDWECSAGQKTDDSSRRKTIVRVRVYSSLRLPLNPSCGHVQDWHASDSCEVYKTTTVYTRRKLVAGRFLRLLNTHPLRIACASIAALSQLRMQRKKVLKK